MMIAIIIAPNHVVVMLTAEYDSETRVNGKVAPPFSGAKDQAPFVHATEVLTRASCLDCDAWASDS